jgi:hypothetical protein
MNRHHSIKHDSAIPTLWWGWIGAPTWWLLQFEIRYAGVPWACRHGLPQVIPVVGAGALLVSMMIVLWAWRAWPRARTATHGFIALGGAWSATLFAFLVFAQLLPDFFLGPCRI